MPLSLATGEGLATLVGQITAMVGERLGELMRRP